MRRRDLIALPALAAAPASAAPVRTALCLNEDNSHWFSTRAGQALTPEFVSSFVDQYAGTQIRELILSANSQRTSFASEVWYPIWKGYQPDGPDDQPLLRSTPEAGRAGARRWIHTAWELAEKKIDCDLVLDSPRVEGNQVAAVNPLGKIPVLVLDDESTLYDSRVIASWSWG